MAIVVTGAKARIKLSGEVMAFVSGVSVTHENRLEEIAQLDNLAVAEYAESGHRCSISINSIKLTNNADIGGPNASNSAMFYNLDFQDDLKKILLQPEMIIEVVEDVAVRDFSGNIIDYNEIPIYIGYGAKFEGGSGQLNARGIWEGSWNFKCRYGVGI